MRRRRVMKCAPMRTPRPRWLEEGFLLVAAAVATIHAESPVLFRAFTFQSDAMIHLFWMRRFSDPSLFNDPLTKALIKAVNALCEELAPHARLLVDAFGVPESCLAPAETIAGGV